MITCWSYILLIDCNLTRLWVDSHSWLLLLCCQPSFWTPVTHLASVWGPWLSSCSAATGGQQQWRGPCQPLLLASQTFLSVGCGEKMPNKDSICAAGPVDVWALSGNTAGCPMWRVWLVQLCSSMVGSVVKLVLWFLLCTVQMTLDLPKPLSVAPHIPVMRKHVCL